MGALPKDQPLTDDVLKHYIVTFEATLPQDKIAALSQLFKMDYQLTSLADEALAELGGHDLTDSQVTETTTATLPTPPHTPRCISLFLLCFYSCMNLIAQEYKTTFVTN